MTTQLSWPWHGSLSKDSYESRLEDGLPIRVVESSNPRGMAVREMRMTLRRGWFLDDLMGLLLGELDPEEIRKDWGPLMWMDGAKKLATDIWGKNFWRHPDVRLNWGRTFDLWWHGAHRRNAEVLAANLPVEVLRKEIEGRKK